MYYSTFPVHFLGYNKTAAFTTSDATRMNPARLLAASFFSVLLIHQITNCVLFG
jgi:hypothetical protein